MINKTRAITVHSASVFASPLASSPCSPTLHQGNDCFAS